MTAQRTIGFFGLGAMGAPMAKNLDRGDVRLLVADADHRRVAALIAEGRAEEASLDTIGATADVVILMLPNSDVVEHVVNGLCASMRPGTLVIDMSSSSPLRTRELGGQLSSRGYRLIDAPVSGGVPRARTAELAIMVGGEPADIDEAEPLLQTMGTSIVRTGPLASAHAMKALNNLASAAGFLIGVEVLLIGSAFGLNPDAMVDALNASTGMNNSTQRKFRQFVLSGSYDSSFSLDLMVKDLVTALDLSDAIGVDASFSRHCLTYWLAAQSSLGPGRDHTELARYAERLTGQAIGHL